MRILGILGIMELLLLDGDGSVITSAFGGLGGHCTASYTRSESHCTHRYPYQMKSSFFKDGF